MPGTSTQTCIATGTQSRQAGRERAKVFVETDDFAHGSYKNLAIAVWRQSTPPESIRYLKSTIIAVDARFPSSVGLLQIVNLHADVPTPEARIELARMLQLFDGILRSSAVVSEGAGFQAAALRSIVTGQALLTRNAFPHLVFASVGGAMARLVADLSDVEGGVSTVDEGRAAVASIGGGARSALAAG